MTRTKIVTVPVENQPGTLGNIARILAKENINIEGLEADALGELGFVRLYTSNPDKAAQALKGRGFPVTTTDVVEVSLANRSGELARLCEKLGQEDINIEYLFGSATPGANTGRVVLRVNDIEAAERIIGQVTQTTTTTAR